MLPTSRRDVWLVEKPPMIPKRSVGTPEIVPRKQNFLWSACGLPVVSYWFHRFNPLVDYYLTTTRPYPDPNFPRLYDLPSLYLDF